MTLEPGDILLHLSHPHFSIVDVTVDVLLSLLKVMKS